MTIFKIFNKPKFYFNKVVQVQGLPKNTQEHKATKQKEKSQRAYTRG
jgi:formiminotetrahydrofolate cyclodeaminase